MKFTLYVCRYSGALFMETSTSQLYDDVQSLIEFKYILYLWLFLNPSDLQMYKMLS